MNTDNLHPWIDPELEARVVALVLGEASDFEREELERLLAGNAELALFKKRIESVHDLLRKTASGEVEEGGETWKLSTERRSALLETLDGDPPENTKGIPAVPEKPAAGKRSRTLWQISRIAALICILFIVGALVLGPLGLDESERDHFARLAPIDKSTHFSRGFKHRLWAKSPSSAVPEVSENFGVVAFEHSDAISTDFESANSPADAYDYTKAAAPSSDRGREALAALEDTLDVAGKAPQLVAKKAQTSNPDLQDHEEAAGRALARASEPAAEPAAPSAPAQSPVTRGAIVADTSGTTRFRSLSEAAPAPALPPAPSAEAAPTLSAKPAPAPAPVAPAPAPAGDDLSVATRRPARQSMSVADQVDEAAKSEASLAIDADGFAAPEARSRPDLNAAIDVGAQLAGGGAGSSAIITSESESDREAVFGQAIAGTIVSPQEAKEGEASLEEITAEVEDLQARLESVTGDKAGVSRHLNDIKLTEELVRDHRVASTGGAPGPGPQPNTPAIIGLETLVLKGKKKDLDRLVRKQPLTETAARESNKRVAGKPLGQDLGDTSRDGAEIDAATLSSGLVTNVYSVPPDFLSAGLTDTPSSDPFAAPAAPAENEGTTLMAKQSAKNLLEEKGISFPPGSSVFFDSSTSQLVVRNTRDNVALVESMIESLPSEEPASASTVLGRRAATIAPPEPAPVPEDFVEISAAAEPFSTFSLHVSDVSFKLAQAALAAGKWPEAARIRLEEFVNAFDYGDPTPGRQDAVSCLLEQATHPLLQQRNLLRVSMATAAAGRSGDTPLRLTILLDNSGSMERADRRETVRAAFALLADQLQAGDQVTLIGFARQPRLLADRFGGTRGDELLRMIADLPSEGGTNLEAALRLAFEKAREQQADNAQNRVVLLTDGAANLGDAEPGRLSGMIESMRDAGIAFDAAGIGADGLNDEILEALTRKGDGRYYLLDRPEDADEGFARQIAGALRPAAVNVKVQVEFNPDRVGRYKLLGFEKHRLDKEDFRDDTVDAAEMAAEEAGVALYQFEARPDGNGDVGSVSVRFRDMSTGLMVEKRWPIPYEPAAPRPSDAEPSMRIATTAALFASRLAGDPVGEMVDLGELAATLAALPQRHREMKRVQQLREMIDQARQLAGE